MHATRWRREEPQLIGEFALQRDLGQPTNRIQRFRWASHQFDFGPRLVPLPHRRRHAMGEEAKAA